MKALLAVLLCLAVPAAAGAAARPLETGLVDLHAFARGEPLSYERTRGAGARYVRILADWRYVATRAPQPASDDPAHPGDDMYDWGPVDREVVLAKRHGLEPLLLIYGAPKWAERCTAPDPDHPCDPDPEALGRFAEAAARRYAGDFEGLPRVRYWQAWNEPNHRFFLYPQHRDGELVSPAMYREMLEAFSSSVKRVHPDNLVVSAGLAPLARPGVSTGPLRFMRELLCMKGRQRPAPVCATRTRLDIWSTNPYTAGGPTATAPGPDDVSLGDLPEMTRLLRAAERAGAIRGSLSPVPFWATEFGWDSRPPDIGGMPLALHARWAAEALYRMWRAGVSAVFWFQLRDEAGPSQPYGGIYESGLYLNGGGIERDRGKPVLRAFRFPFVALRARRGMRVWGRTPEAAPGRVRIELRSGGRWVPVGALRADRFGIFRGRLARSRAGLMVRARAAGERSHPFSLRYRRNHYAPPFGAARLPPPGP
jgi:hypothetical protein